MNMSKSSWSSSRTKTPDTAIAPSGTHESNPRGLARTQEEAALFSQAEVTIKLFALGAPVNSTLARIAHTYPNPRITLSCDATESVLWQGANSAAKVV